MLVHGWVWTVVDTEAMLEFNGDVLYDVDPVLAARAHCRSTADRARTVIDRLWDHPQDVANEMASELLVRHDGPTLLRDANRARPPDRPTLLPRASHGARAQVTPRTVAQRLSATPTVDVDVDRFTDRPLQSAFPLCSRWLALQVHGHADLTALLRLGHQLDARTTSFRQAADLLAQLR